MQTDDEPRIRLNEYAFTQADVKAVMNVFASGRVTQGRRVREFESVFKARYAPDRACAMVNSGSSANLLAAAWLAHQRDKNGKKGKKLEVITPGLTWSTTVAPLIQHGFKPVFVDVGDDYCIDPDEVMEAVTKRTFAIAPVHLLGNPCDMTAIEDIAGDRGLRVWSDACEALGAQWMGKPLGSYGDVTTWSFYYSHHLSAIEGGMIAFPWMDHEVLAWREHGWIRGYPEDMKQSIIKGYPDIDPSFMFDQLGYNVRSTEVNAALAIEQLSMQDVWRERRRYIAEAFDRVLEKAGVEPRARSENAEENPFFYPVEVPMDARYHDAQGAREFMRSRGIETRPIISGAIWLHPWFSRNPKAWRVHGSTPTTFRAHDRGFLVPCHPFMTGEDVEFVATALTDYFGGKK